MPVTRGRKLAAAALTALALAASAPPASAAPGPCRSQAGVTNGSTLQLALTGQYVGRAGDDVTLTCNVVQGGVVVASATDRLGGPVAALAEVVQVPVAYYLVCYEVTIWDITGWGYRYETNCP